MVETRRLLVTGATGAARQQLDIELVGDAQIDDPGAAIGLRQPQEFGKAQLAIKGDRGVEVGGLEVEVA